jgi:hypothetical protein
MHLKKEIFDHRLHQQRLRGNSGCARCHSDPAAPKVRANTTPCRSCHPRMRARSTLVPLPPRTTPERTRAAGYMDALHGLCISCHRRELQRGAVTDPNFSRCGQCHRDTPALPRVVQRMQRQMQASARVPRPPPGRGRDAGAGEGQTTDAL